MNARPSTTRMKPASCGSGRCREDAADGRGPRPEDDEDDGEAEDERQARDDDTPRRAALPELARLDARERREVARDERQHARQDDRDEARGERDAEPSAHHSKRASTSSRRRSSSSSSPDPAGSSGSSGSFRRLQRQTPKARTSAPASTPAIGSHHASRSKPLCGRSREDLLPVVGDERRLDLLRRPARGDLLRDEPLDLLRRLRVGHVERRVAGRAHHLALEVVQRGTRMRTGRRGRREDERSRHHRGEPQHQSDRLRDRAPELAGEAWIRERAAEVRDDPSLPVENVRLRHLGDPVAAGDVARAVREHRERQRVRAHEAPRVGVEVVVVDAEEDDAPAAVARPVTLEHGCLALARIAPRRPEVQHDRLPPVGGQRDLAGPLEPAQRERGRHRAHARGVLLVDDRPDEEREQARDARERDQLSGDLEPLRHAFSAAFSSRVNSSL